MQRIELELNVYTEVPDHRDLTDPNLRGLTWGDQLYRQGKRIGKVHHITQNGVQVDLDGRTKKSVFANHMKDGIVYLKWVSPSLALVQAKADLAANKLDLVLTTDEAAPKFELKNIVPHKDHDGYPIVDADLWVNGVKAVTYIEDTNGGMAHWLTQDAAAYQLFTDWMNTQIPADTERMDRVFAPDLWIEDAIYRTQIWSDVTKVIRAKDGQVVFRTTSDPLGSYRIVKQPFTAIVELRLFLEFKGVGLVIANNNMTAFLDQMLAEEKESLVSPTA